jgi:hypothetical protein
MSIKLFILKIAHYLYKIKRKKYIIAEKETIINSKITDSVFLRLRHRHSFESFDEAFGFLKSLDLRSYYKKNKENNCYYLKHNNIKTTYHLTSGFTPLEKYLVFKHHEQK